MKHFTKLFSRAALVAVLAVLTAGMAWGQTTYQQLTSIADIDESAQYVLGIDGTGFHYAGTSSWGQTALPSAQTPIYYTLKKATDGNSFTAEATISGTKYYLQIPTSNTFSMATSAGTNTAIIIGTTQVSGTNYAVANKTTTARHLRLNGTSGLRSYAGTTGSMAYFYKVVGTPTTYTVSFDAGAGTFVGNTDFPNASNSKTAGTYTLPTATPATGYSFDGWLATGSSTPLTGSYTVSGDVSFTAQYTELGAVSTLTLTATNLELTGSYSSGASKTIDGVTFVHSNLMKSNGRIQAKASTGTIKNTTAFPGDITNVAITHDGTANATTINGSADGTNWTQVATGNGSVTANFSGKGYRYFQITRGSNVAYWTQVEITYAASTDPSITAADVSIAYDATSGSIAYTIGNEPSPAGTLTASVPAGSWITPGSATGSAVPFTCTANEANTARTETVTLIYTYGDNQTVTKDVTVTQAEAPVIYDDIADLFAAATGTSTPVNVSFESWFVTGVSTNGKNVYVSDGTNGFVIFDTNGGLDNSFAAGDMLSSEGEPVVCNLVLYNGFAEITGLNVSDLHITKNQYEEYLAPIAMADLAGVNTGAVVHYDNLTCSVDNNKYYLSDGTTTLQVYNALYAFGSTLVAGKQYNITGVYQQFNTTKEILPRSAADIEEVVSIEPGIILSAYTVNATAAETEGSLTVTYTAIATNLGASLYWYTDDTGTTTTDAPDWIEAEVNETSMNVDYLISANSGEARTAYFKVYALDNNSNEVYSNLVTINQEAYVIDYATLPFTWAGGGKSALLALDGVTGYGLGSDYTNHSPYMVRFDDSNDYIQIKTDSRPGVVTVGVKMIGGSNSSTITVQESADGETFTNVQALTISGASNDILTLETTNAFAAASRFVRLLFTKGSNVGVGPISITKYSTEPSISVRTASVEAPAGENGGTLALSYQNLDISDMTDFAVQFYDAEEATVAEPDWIEVLVAEQDPQEGDGYVVSYFMLENEDAAARTAYFKVYALGDEDYVYSNLVTITQAAPVFAELPFEYDGNGVGELPAGLTQNGLTGGYNSSPKMKFDESGDYLLLRFNEAPGILTFDIKGNTFSGGTFKVQTSTNGTTFTDLVTYTELEGTKMSETFANLPTNVRYIKWVYTEKVNGNVALGNISLTAFNPAAETINLSATLNKGGYWATFFNSSASYMLPEGAQAFTMNSSKELYRLGENGRAIPAGTAVVIVSDTGSITLTKDVTIQSVTVNGGANILSGYNVDTAKPANGKVYVLGIVDGTLGFYELQKSKIPAMKAYYVIENVGE